jgi:hypothetical protein
MSASGISRRKFFGVGLGAAAAAGLAPSALTQSARAQSIPGLPGISVSQLAGDAQMFEKSVEQAFVFMNKMMDGYATGSVTRLSQSYSDQNFGGFPYVAFTYDNAVAIHAYLLRGDADGLARAKVLGDGLIYAQATNFPFADGRFAQAYYVNTLNSANGGGYVNPAAFPFYFYSSAVGDQAWAGMALAQLYKKTGQQKYLTAALLVANWIVANSYNTVGFGGYSFGTNINQFNQSVPSTNGQSTEHNIDVYGFFVMLATLTNNAKADNGTTWAGLAQHAFLFVKLMFNAGGPYFYTGTLGGNTAVNYYPVPEDCQTWSYMSLLDNSYKQTISWALHNLESTDSGALPNNSIGNKQSITGMVFDTASFHPILPNCDPGAVWLEGTAHTVAGIVARAAAGGDPVATTYANLTVAVGFLANMVTAQNELGAGQTINGTPIPLGQGLVASTSVMDTGFYYTYSPFLHIGATGWYLIAALGGNPFQLGYGTVAKELQSLGL